MRKKTLRPEPERFFVALFFLREVFWDSPVRYPANRVKWKKGRGGV